MITLNNRTENLRKQLLTHEIDALLVTKPQNVFYLSGFRGAATDERDGVVLVAKDGVTLFTYQMYEQEAKELQAECPELKVSLLKAEAKLSDYINTTFTKDQKIGFEAAHLTYKEFKSMSEKFDPELSAMKDVVEVQREIKDESELDLISKAVGITKQAFDFLEEQVKPGMTEAVVAKMFLEFVTSHGAEDIAFPTIVAGGANSAKPHHKTSDQRLEDGILLVDAGARVGGYNADLTRTFYLGEQDELFKQRYELLEKAKQAAIEIVKPGAIVSEVWQAAVDVLGGEAENFHKYHTLGHGLGLDIHESPRIYGEGKEVLKPGMVITIEPGLYYPGWGGIRLEDDVLVSDNGGKVL